MLSAQWEDQANGLASNHCGAAKGLRAFSFSGADTRQVTDSCSRLYRHLLCPLRLRLVDQNKSIGRPVWRLCRVLSEDGAYWSRWHTTRAPMRW
jgi:hypothetical protein